jgi:hypothetical protein
VEISSSYRRHPLTGVSTRLTCIGPDTTVSDDASATIRRSSKS